MVKLKRCKWCATEHYMIVFDGHEMDITTEDAEASIAEGTLVTDGMCAAAALEMKAQVAAMR